MPHSGQRSAKGAGEDTEEIDPGNRRFNKGSLPEVLVKVTFGQKRDPGELEGGTPLRTRG